MSKIYFVIFFVVIVLIAGIGMIYASPWFIWSALPGQEGNKLVIDSKIIEGNSGQWVNTLNDTFSINPLSPYMIDAAQIGFSQSTNLTYAAIRPKIGKSVQLINKMESDGWSIRQEKLFIIAQKGHPEAFLTDKYTLSRIIQIIWNTFYISIIKSKGLYPLAIGTLQSINQQTLDSPLSFIVNAKNNQIQINGVRQNDILSAQPTNKPSTSTLNNQEDIAVAIPSEFMSFIPSSLVKKINQVINTGLGIKHTNPNTISIIQASSNVQLSKTADRVELVINNPQKDVLGKLKQIIQMDDQYNYPKKHSFYLPDKTLASEYVPGQTPSSWELYNGNCQLYKGKDSETYICQTENSLLITQNKENTGDNHLQIDETKWLIRDKSNQLHINGSGEADSFQIDINN